MTQTSSEYCEGVQSNTEYSEGVQSNREFDEGAQTNKTFFKLSVLGIVLPASFFDKSLYCEIHLIHSHKYFPKSVIYYICMNMNNFRWLFQYEHEQMQMANYKVKCFIFMIFSQIETSDSLIGQQN